MNNKVADFFDSLAPSWDAQQVENGALIDFLLGKIGIEKGNRVLDVACGTGILTERLYRLSGKDVEAVDISSKMVELAKAKYADNPHLHFRCADFLTASFEEPFDAILIYNAYPHFLDCRALNEALKRNLAKGGKAAILHSLSREALDKHHEAIASHVSRHLGSPSEEFAFYRSDFELLDQIDDESSYLLLLKKK